MWRDRHTGLISHTHTQIIWQASGAQHMNVNCAKSTLRFEDCAFTSTVCFVYTGPEQCLEDPARLVVTVQASAPQTLMSINSDVGKLEFERCDINMPQAQCMMVQMRHCRVSPTICLAGCGRDSYQPRQPR